MRRLVTWGSAVLLLTVTAGAASAQRNITGFIGVGATTTMGDLKDADSTNGGWMVMGGLQFPIAGQSLNLRLDTGVGFNDRESNFDESAVMWTLNGRLSYWLPVGTDRLKPYLLGGAGFLFYKRHPGKTGLDDQLSVERYTLIGAGGGVDYSIWGTSLFLEARYEMGSDDRSFVPIMIGARWGGGGSQ